MISFLKKLLFSSKQQKTQYLFEEMYENLQMYPIQSEENYIRALTHSSFTKKIEEKNERLEFLGDAVINFCVAEGLYYRMNGKDEGTLTKARASIVNRKNLNKIGIEIGIPKFLRHKLSDKQMEEAPDIIGNAFEALMGAFFLDYGMHDTEIFIGKLLMKDFDVENFHKNISDPKSYLLEWVQSRKKQVAFVHHTSPSDNGGLFSVTLKIDGEDRADGSGKNKKEAEQNACLNAIKTLELDS
ncbi:MAG TPA: ribonuclease III [Chitinophagales bacterium]|nr:ribonuclease III [Chitinophagales bacterium]